MTGDGQPTALQLGPGAPMLLPAGGPVWQVQTGTVEIYLAWTGGRRLIAVRDPGGLIFSLPVGAPGEMCLLTSGEAMLTPVSGDVRDRLRAVGARHRR